MANSTETLPHATLKSGHASIRQTRSQRCQSPTVGAIMKTRYDRLTWMSTKSEAPRERAILGWQVRSFVQYAKA